MFLSMLPMIFRKNDLQFQKLGQWKRKWADVSISLPQLQTGLRESWELCLNLCSRRWPNLNLVNNSTPLGLWQLKTGLLAGHMKFKSVFLKIFKLSELRIFRSSLFHSITAEGKKEFWKKLCFTLNRGILLVFLVLYVLTEVGIILNRYFGHLYLKILKKQQFPVPSSFFKGFPNHFQGFPNHFFKDFHSRSLYSFSLDVPLIVPVIANAELYWIEFSFGWNEALYAWSYMISPSSRWGLKRTYKLQVKAILAICCGASVRNQLFC